MFPQFPGENAACHAGPLGEASGLIMKQREEHVGKHLHWGFRRKERARQRELEKRESREGRGRDEETKGARERETKEETVTDRERGEEGRDRK